MMKNPFEMTLSFRSHCRSRCVSWALFAGLVVAMSLCLTPCSVHAEEGEGSEDYTKDEDYNIGSLFNKSTEAMASEEWKKAIFYLDRIISEYGDEASVAEIGPKFGVMHYRRGFSLARMEDFEAALEAYRTCMEQFPNKPDTPPAQKNPLVANAILESAAIKQRLGKFDEAVELYEAFQARAAEAPEGSFSKAFFFIEAGTCYVKTGEMEKGMKIIEQAFDQARGIGATGKDLFRGFLSLVEGWTEAPDDPKAVEKAAHAFIDKYGSSLEVSAYDKSRFNFNPRLIEAARKSSVAGMHTLALRFYSMVATSSDVLEDLEARAAAYGGATSKLQAAIDEEKEKLKDPEGIDLVALFGIANTYQQLGNYRAGFGVYDYLEYAYPGTKHRADILFGAFQCAAVVGDDATAVAYGDDLLTEFPQYENRDKAIGLFVTKLFFAGDYAQALERAVEMRADVKEGSKEKEIVDFVIPGSLFYLGRYAESIPELTVFIEKYPNSPYIETVRRLDGLGSVIEQDWETAATKLDSFIEDYPDSKMIGDVLVDRAVTHYSLNQYDETLEVVQTLRVDHAGSENIDRALNLAGDVHYSREDYPKSEEAYVKAREAAQRRQHDDPHAHATAQLVAVCSTQEKWEDAAKYYDEFFARHEGNRREAQVVVGGMDALREVGRIGDGLVNLEKVIVRTANSEAAAEGDDLERAMGSYVTYFGEEKGAAELEKRLYEFPAHGMPIPPLLKAWLMMSRIDVYEDPGNKEAFPSVDAKSKVAYGELAGFDKSILPPYILVKVGRQLRKKSDPIQAVPWFEEVQKRGQGEYTGVAELGMAQIIASSGVAEKEQEALAMFDKVIEAYPGEKYEEEAMVDKAHLLFKREDWNNAALIYQKIFENKRWKKDRELVVFNMALAFENAGNAEMALNAYTAFFAPPYESKLDYSAEARLKAAELQFARGNKEKAFSLIRITVYKMHKLAGHPVAGQHIKKAFQLYQDWKPQMAPEFLDELDQAIAETVQF